MQAVFGSHREQDFGCGLARVRLTCLLYCLVYGTYDASLLITHSLKMYLYFFQALFSPFFSNSRQWVSETSRAAALQASPNAAGSDYGALDGLAEAFGRNIMNHVTGRKVRYCRLLRHDCAQRYGKERVPWITVSYAI